MSFDGLKDLMPTVFSQQNNEMFSDILPDIGVGVSSLVAGIQSRNLAQISADRQEDIGEEDSRLRAIQARRLLGTFASNTGGRGLVIDDDASSTAATYSTTRWLEGVDIARARFRFDSLADQVRRKGDAELAVSIIDAGASIASAGRTRTMSKRIRALEATTLQPRPFVV